MSEIDIVYKVGFFRPSVQFAVRVEGEKARAEGEYCKHTRSKDPLKRGTSGMRVQDLPTLAGNTSF